MNTALISVVIPIYKVENYLNRCVDSVLKQTYRNLEILLVDDGSPDRCGEICDHYAALDSRIHVIHQENRGLSCARNAGMERSTGDYLFFLDSDDYIHPDTLVRLLEKIRQDDSDIACCSLLCVDENGTPLPSPAGPQNEILTGHDLQKKGFGKDCWAFTVVWNKLYKRELLLSSDRPALLFAAGKLHEDEFFSYRAADRAKRVTCINDRFYYYVQREGSIVSKRVTARNLDVIEAYLEKIEWYRNKGDRELTDRSLRQAFTVMSSLHRKLDMHDSASRTRYRDYRRQLLVMLYIKHYASSSMTFCGGLAFTVSEKLYRKLTQHR